MQREDLLDIRVLFCVVLDPKFMDGCMIHSAL